MAIFPTNTLKAIAFCVGIATYFLPQYACAGLYSRCTHTAFVKSLADFCLQLQVQSESRCLTEKSNFLKVKCPSNKITRVLKAFYGYSWSNDCHFIEKDCTAALPVEDIYCDESECSMKIVESPIIMQDCWNLMSSYVQVDYECISG